MRLKCRACGQEEHFTYDYEEVTQFHVGPDGETQVMGPGGEDLDEVTYGMQHEYECAVCQIGEVFDQDEEQDEERVQGAG